MVLLQNIWWYLVLIGVMIMIHELGHYWAARFFDVKVETFSFGFGPRLFGFRRGETDFRFSAILFGGYVKMAGEQYGDGTTAGTVDSAAASAAVMDPRNLQAKPRWQRMIIAFAGPAINIVLAVALLAGLFMFRYEKLPNPVSPVIGYLVDDGAAAKAGVKEGDQLVQINNLVDPTWQDVQLIEVTSAKRPFDVWVKRNGDRLHFSITPVSNDAQGIASAGWLPEFEIQVGKVTKGQPADRAGLEPGDLLISANGQPIRSATKLTDIENQLAGAPFDLVFERKGVQHTVTIKPQLEDPDHSGKPKWLMGISPQPRVEITKLSFPEAVRQSVRNNVQNATVIFKFLEGIVEQRMSPKSISGPIGIAALSGEAAREGLPTYLMLMAAVSLNLAVFNLLPIPILDGGVMLLLFIEMLMRRDLDLRVKEMVLKIGFVFLMAVVIFVIYNDLTKIFPPN